MIIFLSISDERTKNRFGELYETYSRYLYTIGLRILKDEELASDAIQQCYFKIYQSIDKIKEINSKQTRSFLGIIMRNESLTIYNRYSSLNHAAEPLEDELFLKYAKEFDQWEKEAPHARVPKDAESKILDMADNFYKLLSKEEKRKRLKKFALVAAAVITAGSAILIALSYS